MRGVILRSIHNENSAKIFKAFVRFLKEKGLYVQFFKIMKSGPPGDYQNIYRGNLLYFFNNCRPELWTNSCFTWAQYNKYGVVDWGSIHSLWCAELLKMLNNEI